MCIEGRINHLPPIVCWQLFFGWAIIYNRHSPSTCIFGANLLSYKEWAIFQISFLGIFINHFICCYVAKNRLLCGRLISYFLKKRWGKGIDKKTTNCRTLWMLNFFYQKFCCEVGCMVVAILDFINLLQMKALSRKTFKLLIKIYGICPSSIIFYCLTNHFKKYLFGISI